MLNIIPVEYQHGSMLLWLLFSSVVLQNHYQDYRLLFLSDSCCVNTKVFRFPVSETIQGHLMQFKVS